MFMCDHSKLRLIYNFWSRVAITEAQINLIDSGISFCINSSPTCAILDKYNLGQYSQIERRFNVLLPISHFT